jgi:hypothetical protein
MLGELHPGPPSGVPSPALIGSEGFSWCLLHTRGSLQRLQEQGWTHHGEGFGASCQPQLTSVPSAPRPPPLHATLKPSSSTPISSHTTSSPPIAHERASRTFLTVVAVASRGLSTLFTPFFGGRRLVRESSTAARDVLPTGEPNDLQGGRNRFVVCRERESLYHLKTVNTTRDQIKRGAGFRGKGSGQEAGRSPPVGLPGVRQLISSNLLPPISPPQREAGAHAHAHASSLHASAGPPTGAPPWETLKSLLPRSSPLVTTQMKPLLPRSSSILTTLHARPVSLIS